MAYVEHKGGDQLPQTRAKAQANFEEVIATTAVVEADLIKVGSGMGLIKFRDVCQKNFQTINGLVAFTPKMDISDGDMLWDVREKLEINFASIDAVA